MFPDIFEEGLSYAIVTPLVELDLGIRVVSFPFFLYSVDIEDSFLLTVLHDF
jgi:hypothetical protein